MTERTSVLQLILNAIRGKEEDYTKGSINRAIVLLSIPMILEMVMESLFAVVDMFFVAKIGVDAVATVGYTESVITLVYSVAIGLSAAVTAMVARRIGEKDREAAAEAAGQSILICLSVGLSIGVAGFYFAPDILRLMGATEAIQQSGVHYTRILFSTNIVIIFLFVLNGVFRGAGNASLAMTSLWIANGCNMILDPLLIFGIGPFPELGVTGAAVATSIGRGIGVAFQLFILFGGVGILRIGWRHLRAHWSVIRKLLDVAASGFLQFFIASASWIFLMHIISYSGSNAVAGYVIAIRIIIFTILPSWGLSNAAATLVGQNLGAQQPERAEISVWRAAFYNMLFLLVIGIVFFLAAEPLIRIFTGEPEVVANGVLALRIICVGYVFFAYGMVISQAFNGAGDTRTPMFINLVCFWMVEIPLGYFLSVTLEWGLAGVCIAIASAETLLAILAVLIFRRGRWKSTKI